MNTTPRQLPTDDLSELVLDWLCLASIPLVSIAALVFCAFGGAQ